MTKRQLHRLITKSEDGKTDHKATLVIKSKDQKAEFIKDVMAFANSHDPGNAYLVIGAKDKKVMDISGLHLDGATLREIVNSVVDPAIRFEYFEKSIDGQTVGLVEIPQSSQRFHLVSKDYVDKSVKLLRRSECWIRDGDSKRPLKHQDLALWADSLIAEGSTEPSMRVRFTNGSNEVALSALWSVVALNEYIAAHGAPYWMGKANSLAVKMHPFGVGTVPLEFEISNMGTTEASKFLISIDLPKGCSVPETAQRPTGKGRDWQIQQFDDSMIFESTGLLHMTSLTFGPFYFSFPEPNRTYEITWFARTGNRVSLEEGVLHVHLAPDGTPPTFEFPK